MGIEHRDFGTRGRPSYSPRLLMRLWIYGYFERIRSCRALEKACRQHVGFMWLCGNQPPDHNTLWRFWTSNRESLRRLFEQSIRVSDALGLVGLTLQAVDGTKIQAACHAGKGYDAKDLERRLVNVDKQIKELEVAIEEAEKTGQAPETDLPSNLHDKKALREAVQRAKEQLQSAPARKYCHPQELEAQRIKQARGGKPFGYNAQAVVDDKAQIIVAADAVAEATDYGQLTPMLGQAASNRERLQASENKEESSSSLMSLGDGGYSSNEQIAKSEAEGHEVLMPVHSASTCNESAPYHTSKFHYDSEGDVVRCPQGRELPFRRTRTIGRSPQLWREYRSAEACRDCPVKEQCTKDRHGRTINISQWHEAGRRHAEKMKQEANQDLLKKRAKIVEPVFGQIKSNGGFKRWTFKGLKKVQAQWFMLCSAWNLKVAYQKWRSEIMRSGTDCSVAA